MGSDALGTSGGLFLLLRTGPYEAHIFTHNARCYADLIKKNTSIRKACTPRTSPQTKHLEDIRTYACYIDSVLCVCLNATFSVANR